MERFVDWFISLMLESGVIKFIGGLLLAVSSVALMLGVRLQLVLHHVEQTSDQLQTLTNSKTVLPTQPKLFEQWPIIQAMLPETPIGFTIWISILIAAALLVRFGEEIELVY